MAAVLTLLIGAAALATGWAGWPARVVLAGAAVGPYLLVFLLGRRRRVPIALVALVVLMTVVVAAAAAAGSSVLTLPAALRDAVPSLLTAPRPAPGTPALLLPGVLLAALAGTWAGARACRANRGAVAPAAAGATLYLAGALLTAGESDPRGILAAALVVAAAANWLDRGVESRGRILARAVPATISGIAVVGLLAVMVPAGAGFEPRELIVPPVQPLVERNPLPRLPAFAEQGDAVLLRHAGSGTRLHMVALVAFNGTNWQARTSYRPLGAVAGSGLPAGGTSRQEVLTDVTIDGLDGPWLPAPGDPTAVSLDAAMLDAETGSLVLPTGLRTGLRYQVRSLLDTPAEADLAVAGVPRLEQYLAVPRLPYLFAEYLQRVVRGASTPFEQAVLIEDAVRLDRRLVVTAPVGSSYARLSTFLFGQTGQPGAQVGTSEQFATAFAVLARAAGLPTRVVVGFRPGTKERDGTWVVRGRDALAWPEVYFTGQGWVPFDPTPAGASRGTAEEQSRQEMLNRIGQAALPRPAPPVPVATAAPPVPVAQPRPAVESRVDRLLWTVGGLVLAVLALLLGGRAVRRIRHRRAGARGAWSEVLDLLLLADRSPPRSHPAPRVAAELVGSVPLAGVHPAVRLAFYADRAAFSPVGGGPAVPGLWADLRRLKSAVRRTVPWYRRTIWPVDPRPLLRR